jgi:disulfide bond formation protein DsbB
MRLNSLFRQRPLFLGAFLVCVALMVTALIMQYTLKLEPCPLCIFQRVFVVALGIIALIAALHDPGLAWRRVYGVLIVIFGVLGMLVAGRHVWLQNLPADQVPECGPGLAYMLDAFPLTEALSLVFRGSGECADVQWVFLGLTIPGWTLVIFIAFTIFGLLLIATRLASAPRGVSQGVVHGLE